MSFKLTLKALDDLKSIAVYMRKEWGGNQEILYLKKIDNAFHLIDSNPNAGTYCDEIRIGYKKYTIGKHIIFYKFHGQSKNDILIVRVLHVSMDTENHL